MRVWEFENQMRNEIKENPFIDRNGIYAFGHQNFEEMLEYFEDMVLLTGCPVCSSLNTKIITTDTGRIMLCLDCGITEQLPPPS